MLGDQQSSPTCGSSDLWFSGTFCAQSARSSTPIARPIARHALRLKLAPSMFGLGYDVGQRTAPVAASGGAQRDCTPWMQFVPQSYSGSPSRGTAPAGDSRAVSSGAFSAHASRAIRSSTRACVPRLASQKAKPAVAGVAHARGIAPSPYGLGRTTPETRSARASR